MTQTEYLTYEEAAQRFNVGVSTVRSWVRAGLIKKYRKPLDNRVYVRADEIVQLRLSEPKEDV